jgi:hypothetical protein
VLSGGTADVDEAGRRRGADREATGELKMFNTFFRWFGWFFRRGDTGLEVLDFLFQGMGIDERWSVRQAREFTWWGHELAQRVSVDRARRSHGHRLFRIRARTDVLRNVPGDPTDKLADLNKLATLSALVWDPVTRRVGLACTAYVHAGVQEWLPRVLLGAIGLQAADAERKAPALARWLGGEPDTSAHPTEGRRPDPDEMLSIVEAFYVPAGRQPSPFQEADFDEALTLPPQPWVLASGGGPRLTAEFPFTGTSPAGFGPGLETALLTASAEEPHPALGSGAVIRLILPTELSSRRAAELAVAMNAAEAAEWTVCHLLGAWSTGPVPGRPDAPHNCLTFATFLPARTYRRGLIHAMTTRMAMRTKWAKRYLDRHAHS